MSIRAIAKKKLGFRNTETGEIVTASPYEYATLPDWVVKDPMYKWALQDGSLEVVKADKPAAKIKPPADPPNGDEK